MARTYKRDSRGRFAGGGGGSSGGRGGRPKARMQERGRNRLTRDNAGKITGQGGSGATARGGRLKTAAGNQRGAVLMKAKGGIAGTVGKGGKVKGGTTAKKVPKLKFDAAATSRRLARATTRIDKAFDEQNTFMVNRLAKARGSYMQVQKMTKGNAAQARSIYLKEARYSTVSNPKNPKTPKQGVASKGKTLPHSEAMARRTESMLKKGEQIGIKAQNYLRDRGSLQAEIGSKLSSADGRAGRVTWANRNRLAQIRMQRVNQARKERRGGFS